MNEQTITALERLNRRFYQRHAAEFDATREAPWPGWSRVLELAAARREAAEGQSRLAVLDAGCGNGRFARSLAALAASPFDYLGLDASLPLLALAHGRPPAGGPPERFVCTDLTSPDADLPVAGAFDLVVAFGLMHHVPGGARREALARRLARRLAPGGLLAISFWQFADRERFRRRIVSWSDHNARVEEAIDVGQLEPGDHLLAWGEPARGTVRYCHHAGSDEAASLVRRLGLRLVESFRADGEGGGLNLYCVLRRPV